MPGSFHVPNLVPSQKKYTIGVNNISVNVYLKHWLTKSAAETESFLELTSLNDDDDEDDDEVAEDTLNMLRKDATGAILLTSLFFGVFIVTFPPSVTSLSDDSS